MSAADAPRRVGVVGAGPVGMALAARLAAHGVETLVLERHPAPRRQGSKACLVQGDALEVLGWLGLGDAVAARGLTWRTGHTYVRGREVRRDEYPARVGYGPFVNISQWDVEQVLRAHLDAQPSSTTLWGHEVVGYAEHPEGVHVTTRDGAGGEHVHDVAWLVGCDGVRSTVRGLAPVTWTGYTHGDRFLITDLRCALPLPKERHFHYDPPFNPGRQVVMHPQPDDVWRIDWQLPADTDVEAEVASGEFDRRVRRVVGDVPYEVEWRSTYRFHQRVVDRFVAGRVVLAGDAAHAFPPYGSRGMNSGFQDADNLAWKLALVVHGAAGTELVETYHAERRAAADENLAVTERTLRFMVPPSRLRHAWRRVLLAASRVTGRASRHVDSGRMAAPFRYTRSPIVTTRRPVDGALVPDALLEPLGGAGDGPRRLRTLLGHDFVLVRFPAAVPRPRPALPEGCVVDVVDPGLVDLGPVEPDGAGRGDTPVAWCDPAGAVRAAFGLEPDSWALVRPDGHVAATGPLADLDVAAELVRAGGTPTGLGPAAGRVAVRPHPAADLAATTAGGAA